MITVHTFSQGPYYFAVDGGSAAIHQLDVVAYDILRLWLKTQAVASVVSPGGSCPEGEGENSGQGTNPLPVISYDEGAQLSPEYRELVRHHGEGAIREAKAELEDLVRAGLLLFDDAYVDDLIGEQGIGYPLKALCLNISHDCNLRCRYCFAHTGDFGGERLNMPWPVAQQAIDFLLANSPGRERVEVDFFGGEPLLNLDVVKATVEYATQRAKAIGKEIRFTLTTNGVLLDDGTAEYLDQAMFNVVLSLDGRPEVNDRLRVYPGGAGTYAEILPGFKHMARLREDRQYYVRGTYTAYNRDFYQDVRHLVEVGFHRVSVEPVVADSTRPYALSAGDLPTLLAQYDELAEYYLACAKVGRGFEFYHFNLALLEGQCLAKRLTGCGAGGEYLAVTPDGDIYPCHQFVGQEEYCLGNLRDGRLDQDLQQLFRTSHVLSKPECRGCWARYFCSGGCHANAVNRNGDIKKPYELGCALLKKRLECSIYIQASLTD